MSETLLQALVDKALGAMDGVFHVVQDGLQVTIGPALAGGYILEVQRRGAVGEREAVDVAVDVHRLIGRRGLALSPEMLAYRGSERSRCFVLAPVEAASA